MKQKAEVNFYKKTGKWYMKEVVEFRDIDVVVKNARDLHPEMNFTIHFVEENGFLQPYRMFVCG